MKPLLILFTLFQFSGIFASHNPTVIKDTIMVNENNVNYKIAEDPKNYYVAIETEYKKTSRTILKEGVTIYFDIKGKKKKRVFVRYPNTLPKPNQRRQRNIEEEEPSREENMENLPQEAIYSYFHTQREFHIALNDMNMNVNIDRFERNFIKYSLRIPKHKINDNPKKDLSKLTIGILIGRDRTDETNNEQRGGGGQSGMQMGGGMSGSGRGMSGGGRSGGGMRGEGNGGVQRPSQENRTQATAIWIDTNPEQ